MINLGNQNKNRFSNTYFNETDRWIELAIFRKNKSRKRMIHLEEPNQFFLISCPVEAKQLMTEIYVLSKCIIKTLLLLRCFDQNRITKIKLYNFRKICPVNSLKETGFNKPAFPMC